MLRFLVICSLWMFLINAPRVDGFSFVGNLTRVKRAEDCGGFECKSDGKCIASVDECNGIEDCEDGSDETEDCKQQWCPNYLFRCSYGACISAIEVCDGNKDCKDNSDETGPNCKTKPKTKCGPDKFQCNSGECINSIFQCNGKADCRDKSDETESCKDDWCPSYLYRCDYGACVNKNSKCNGVLDCLDGSDEAPSKCGGKAPPTKKPTTTTQSPPTKKPPTKKPTTPEPVTVISVVTPTITGGCILPHYPENGRWQLAASDVNLYPGQTVQSWTIIQGRCDPTFLLIGTNISYCMNGKWSETFKCVKSCPPWESTATTTINCTYQGLPRECSKAIDDTEAVFKCAPFHEDRSTSNRRYCLSDSWDNVQPRCLPVCGEKRVANSPLSVGGTAVDEGDYPWQVAIFRYLNDEFTAICGGSILTGKVIITAAHCMLTDEDINNMKEPNRSEFEVAAGKYYREYKHKKDSRAQYRKLKEIVLSPQYRGQNGNYEGDLALLIVEQEFRIGPQVQPVCRDNGNILHLQRGQVGVVTGWGYTQAGSNPAEVLTELDIPFEEDTICKSVLPEQYVRRFYATDKICGGYFNQSKAICSGDSGGGLVFEHNGRYYIRGLVSISPRVDNTCDIQQYTLFTNVNFYNIFIDKTINKYDRLI